jgi:hypothetical protein
MGISWVIAPELGADWVWAWYEFCADFAEN